MIYTKTLGDFMRENDQLRARLEKAEAACSAQSNRLYKVKATLAYVSYQRLPLGNTVLDTLPEHWQLEVSKALDREDESCGSGWLSPEKVGRVRELFKEYADHTGECIHWSTGHCDCGYMEAVKELDGSAE